MANIGFVGLGVMGSGMVKRLAIRRPYGNRLQSHPKRKHSGSSDAV